MATTRALVLQAPDTPPAVHELTPTEDENGTVLTVVACAPTRNDVVMAGTSWPRVPGGALAGDDEQGQRWLCGGLVPCGQCPPCQTAHHEACHRPYLPGSSASTPGGLATRVFLPGADHLAPLPTAASVHCVVALIASAGLTYQATASAGMVPGDTVFVFGDPGPGALPLRTLVALGLCPVWISPAPRSSAPDGVELTGSVEDLPEASSPRCHILELGPCSAHLADVLALTRQSLTLTFALPGLPDDARPPLAALLAGPLTARWVSQLHPHLVLDLAALALQGELDVAAQVEVCSLDDFPRAWGALIRGETARWPVLVNPQ